MTQYYKCVCGKLLCEFEEEGVEYYLAEKWNDGLCIFCRHEKLINTNTIINIKQTGGTMNFNEYQKQASETAVYPDKGDNLYYPTLGLAGEAGEIANKVKKVMRDLGGKITAEKVEQLKGELGDVMWYLASLCTELGLEMADVAQANIDKLFSRKERGTIQGDGDNR